jgi:hypothetical protein
MSDLNTAIDAALSEGGASSTTAPSATPGETPSTSAPREQTGSAAPAEPQAGSQSNEAEAAEPDWTDEEHQATPSDESGKHRIVAKNRFDALYKVYKAAKALEGTFGHLPTPEEAQQYLAATADLELMTADLSSGDPERVQRFVEHWGQAAPEALPLLAEAALTAAVRANPQFYQQLQSSLISDTIQGLYRQVAALRNTNPGEFRKQLYAVQMLDWMINGDYRDAAELEQAPQEESDPRLQRLQQLEAEELRRAEAARSMAIDSFNQRLSNTMAEIRESVISKALAPVAASFEGRPTLLGAIKDTLVRSAVDEMRSDQLFMARFTAARDRAFQSGDENALNSAMQIYNERFSRAVRGMRDKVIREVTGQLVAQNQATHQALEKSSQRREPGSTGAAPNPLSGDRFREAVQRRDFEAAFASLGLD